MADVTPAILPKNYEELKNKSALLRKLATRVQIDICDGAFVPNRTWPFTSGAELDAHFLGILNEEEGLPFWEEMDFELDLMASDCLENFDAYAKLGASSLIFHLGAIGDIGEFRDFLEGMDPYLRDNMQIGVALDLDFLPEDFFPLCNCVDFAQVMGIGRIGYQGEKFDDRCLEYVRALREKFSDLPIAVDGGVTLENAPDILSAGADRLVIGSALFNADDIIGRLEDFRSL